MSTTDAYLEHLRVERRLAEHTLESYARDLGQLAAFAQRRDKTVEALDWRDLEALVRYLMGAGFSPRSVSRAVAAVRGFYRFLVVNQGLEQNPAEDLRGPRAWPALPKFLSSIGLSLPYRVRAVVANVKTAIPSSRVYPLTCNGPISTSPSPPPALPPALPCRSR